MKLTNGISQDLADGYTIEAIAWDRRCQIDEVALVLRVAGGRDAIRRHLRGPEIEAAPQCAPAWGVE